MDLQPITRRRLLTNSILAGSVCLVPGVCADKDLTIETQYGKVRGVSVQGTAVFKGIPYGGPTEAAKRFLPPSKPAKWAGIYDATETGPRCVQTLSLIH